MEEEKSTEGNIEGSKMNSENKEEIEKEETEKEEINKEETEKEEINKEETEKEEINKEEIIENFIEHIRDLSELTDDDITSVIEDVTEEDEELFNILEKLVSKSQEIREKILSVTGMDLDIEKDERQEETDDILEAIEDSDYAYPLEEIIQSLKKSGYADPGTVITDAINYRILYVDSIDEDEVVFLALTKEGERLWELHNY